MRPGSGVPLGRILVGDVRERLTELPDAAVDTVITSPPYWAMRDYGQVGQIGAEATVEAWAEQIAGVAAELARVLTPTGSLWLNVGDGYSRHPREGAPKKGLLLGPERVAAKLTDSGWLLRNKIIWAKANPMPFSGTDRLTTTHEYLYFFTRASHYYFDLDPIRELPSSMPRGHRTRRAGYPPRDAVPSLGGGSSPRIDLNQGLAGMKAAGRESHPLGKNPGDVWIIPTASYHRAHFATFPVELVRRPLLATCPERVCIECGQSWQRVLQRIDGRLLAVGSLRPVCGHPEWRPGRVLDPFMGSGTVAVAAEQHSRDWLGIELNPEYAELAEKRLAEWREKAGIP